MNIQPNFPICSMVNVWNIYYIYHQFKPNVGKYSSPMKACGFVAKTCVGLLSYRICEVHPPGNYVSLRLIIAGLYYISFPQWQKD